MNLYNCRNAKIGIFDKSWAGVPEYFVEIGNFNNFNLVIFYKLFQKLRIGSQPGFNIYILPKYLCRESLSKSQFP